MCVNYSWPAIKIDRVAARKQKFWQIFHGKFSERHSARNTSLRGVPTNRRKRDSGRNVDALKQENSHFGTHFMCSTIHTRHCCRRPFDHGTVGLQMLVPTILGPVLFLSNEKQREKGGKSKFHIENTHFVLFHMSFDFEDCFVGHPVSHLALFHYKLCCPRSLKS